MRVAGTALATPACCSFSGPGSASFASVTIQNHPAQETADGYRCTASRPDQLVFDKEAARATALSRDGIAATQAGARTLNRVRAEKISLGTGSHRLQWQAYLVSGAGNAFFEDEVRLTSFRSLPYQSLLNSVKA